MTPANPLDPVTDAVVAAISAPRFAPYLAAAGGSTRDALRPYQWGIDLSGAAYETLHIFEVFLRNSMDARVSAWNATQTDRSTGRQHSGDWLLDPARLIVRLAGSDIAKATSQAQNALRAPRH